MKKETDKKLDKDENIDLKDSHRVRNALPAEADDDYVTNSQCRERSGKKEDGSIDFLGPILGGIAGAVTGSIAGGVSALFGASLSAGLTSVGSLAAGAAGGAASGAALAGGISIGSEAALEAAKGIASDGMDQLIDNVKDDIANGGSGSGDPVQTGNLINGASIFDGLVRLARNA